MKINLIGQIYGCMGIPNHTRDLFREICRQNKDTTIYPLSPNYDSYDLDGLRGNLADASWQSKEEKLTGVTFIFWTPDIYPQLLRHIDRENSIIIGYPIFEWTTFTQAFRDGLNSVDYCAFSSTWAKDTAVSNGVVDSQTLVVPAGVNEAYLATGLDIASPRKFLFVAKYEKRKSVDECLQSFYAKFPNGEAILDVLLTDPHDPKFSAEDTIEAIIGPNWRKTFNLIGKPSKISDMVSLYKAHRFILVPSKAGGTELPMIEAMACGCLPIATNYGGMAHYLPDKYPFAVPVDMLIPMYDNRWYKPGIRWGQWAQPDWLAFERLLVEANGLRTEPWISYRAELFIHIQENFRYSHIVRDLLKFMEDKYACKTNKSTA